MTNQVLSQSQLVPNEGFKNNSMTSHKTALVCSLCFIVWLKQNSNSNSNSSSVLKNYHKWHTIHCKLLCLFRLSFKETVVFFNFIRHYEGVYASLAITLIPIYSLLAWGDIN